MRNFKITVIFLLLNGLCYGQWTSTGNNFTTGGIVAQNPNNTSATASLSWQNDVARIRMGGAGNGASNGLDIQGPGDTSLLRIENSIVTSKGSLLSKANLISSNSNNLGATVALSWLNDVARIRVGGSGIGATSGLDIQTTGDQSLMRILHSGNVGIGTTTPDAKLTVKGDIHVEEVKVDLSVPGPDYVFKKDYNLRSLEEVQNYIKAHGHLPNIPSAQEMEKNGIQLGEMNMKLLEKIEELTLYTMGQEEKLTKQEKRLQTIEKLLNKNQ